MTLNFENPAHVLVLVSVIILAFIGGNRLGEMANKQMRWFDQIPMVIFVLACFVWLIALVCTVAKQF